MTTPGLRDLILLETPIDVRLNPSGSVVAVRVEYPHWGDNRYARDVLVIDVGSGISRRLTRGADCAQMRWLDEETLAVLKSDGSGETKPQVYLYQGLTGDGWQVTDAQEGVSAFEPFAAGIVYLARRVDDPEVEAREDSFGSYTHVASEPGRVALHYLDLTRLAEYERLATRATTKEREHLVRPEVELSALIEEQVAIQGVVASPAGDALYVNAWPTPDLARIRESSVHRIALDADAAVAEFVRQEQARKSRDLGAGIAEETDERRAERDLSYLGQSTRLPLPPRATAEAVSPDGNGLLFAFPGRDPGVSTNVELWAGERDALLGAETIEEARALLRDVTADLDQRCTAPVWHERGIDLAHVQSTAVVLKRVDPTGKPSTPIDTGAVNGQFAFHSAPAGQVAFVGDSASAFHEVFVTGGDGVRQLTDFGSQLQGWDLGEVRTIEWTSTDGTVIEGVLRLPPGFDPSRRYPLAFIVHGGPTWVDLEQQVPGLARRYYPEIQLAAKGVIVLHPNYRGSLGRGLAFQELNVGNLGVGDLWDLESAIDHMDSLGWVDTDKVGCMGWSQGGYISAFAALHSDRFTAVSVGAGVSDWYSYAISNDIPDFTRDFLATDLFATDRTPFTQSSPMAAIDKASTPMLIQHGGKDQRVPLSNAMELYRGMQEKGVPVELFVFPEFAHPITKPRENHAVLHQNLSWFSHWLLGEELDLEGSAHTR